MFDFAWSEIAIIGVVALVAIGPKDMPVAIRSVAGMVKKARKIASEFQTHVDEMVHEANLGDVKGQLNELTNFDIKSEIEKAVDPDGTIRDAFLRPLQRHRHIDRHRRPRRGEVGTPRPRPARLHPARDRGAAGAAQLPSARHRPGTETRRWPTPRKKKTSSTTSRCP